MKNTTTFFLGVIIVIGAYFLLNQNGQVEQVTVENVTTNAPQQPFQTLEANKVVLEQIGPTKARDLINNYKDNPYFKIIDIRTKEEFDTSKIEGAINIDFYGDFEREIDYLNRDGIYLIYCQSGNRSGQAMPIFEKMQFQQVYELAGGFNSWSQ